MLSFGFSEILVILVLAIVVVGPDRLPEMLRFLGRQYGKLMRASNELRRAFMMEADKAEMEKRAGDLRKRREAARTRADEARQRAREAADERAEVPVPRDEPALKEDPGVEPGSPPAAAMAPPAAPADVDVPADSNAIDGPSAQADA